MDPTLVCCIPVSSIISKRACDCEWDNVGVNSSSVSGFCIILSIDSYRDCFVTDCSLNFLTISKQVSLIFLFCSDHVPSIVILVVSKVSTFNVTLNIFDF